MLIYVINLDRHPQRLDHMAQQLTAHHLAFTRVCGVDGRKLTGADASYAHNPIRARLNAGELGCLLSHMRCWRALLATDEEWAVIMEDDIHLADDFGTFLRDVRIAADDYAVHRLEAHGARVTTARAANNHVQRRREVELFTNVGGSAAYIVNRNTAHQLVDQSSQYRRAIDIELFDRRNRTGNHGLRVLQWVPAPCIQDQRLRKGKVRIDKSVRSLPSDLGFFSSIVAPASATKRPGKASWRKGVVGALRDGLRPVHTAAYSLILRRKGLARLEVPFG